MYPRHVPVVAFKTLDPLSSGLLLAASHKPLEASISPELPLLAPTLSAALQAVPPASALLFEKFYAGKIRERHPGGGLSGQVPLEGVSGVRGVSKVRSLLVYNIVAKIWDGRPENHVAQSLTRSTRPRDCDVVHGNARVGARTTGSWYHRQTLSHGGGARTISNSERLPHCCLSARSLVGAISPGLQRLDPGLPLPRSGRHGRLTGHGLCKQTSSGTDPTGASSPFIIEAAPVARILTPYGGPDSHHRLPRRAGRRRATTPSCLSRTRSRWHHRYLSTVRPASAVVPSPAAASAGSAQVSARPPLSATKARDTPIANRHLSTARLVRWQTPLPKGSRDGSVPPIPTIGRLHFLSPIPFLSPTSHRPVRPPATRVAG
jgi:hypothetical protein